MFALFIAGGVAVVIGAQGAAVAIGGIEGAVVGFVGWLIGMLLIVVGLDGG